MSSTPIEAIEWHDLPVGRFSINESGIEFSVHPFNEESQSYDSALLVIENADSIEFNIQGQFTPKDLDGLEITSFDFEDSSPGKISGRILLLCGWPSKCWEIKFINAFYRLVGPNQSFNSDPAATN